MRSSGKSKETQDSGGAGTLVLLIAMEARPVVPLLVIQAGRSILMAVVVRERVPARG